LSAQDSEGIDASCSESFLTTKPHTEAQVNRRTTMTKLNMFLAAAFAAATVAIGALAAASSASAYPPPPNCVWIHVGAYHEVLFCF
jgi:hypothetical protein